MTTLAIRDPLWHALAEFRFCIRRFSHFSEQASRGEGLLPQQHQLLLAVRGAQEDATIGYLAERMFLRHHSVVGLVDRLAARGYLARARHDEDRRRVTVRLTAKGQAALDQLTQVLLQEYETEGPALVRALANVMQATPISKRRRPA